MARKKKRSRPRQKAETKPAPLPPTSVNRLGVAIAILLLAGLAAAVVVVGRRPPEQASEPSALERWKQAEARDVSISPDDYALGPAEAPVTVVEFSDFECPYCRGAASSLEELIAGYEEKVRLVFKNYPLDTACNPHVAQLHPLACEAAAMARCAGAQDRFWEMHDALFGLPNLAEESLAPLPEALGLDTARFAACMSDDATLAPIRADIEQGNQLGVTGTPALFLNGRAVANYEAGALRPVIDHVLSNP